MNIRINKVVKVGLGNAPPILGLVINQPGYPIRDENGWWIGL